MSEAKASAHCNTPTDKVGETWTERVLDCDGLLWTARMSTASTVCFSVEHGASPPQFPCLTVSTEPGMLEALRGIWTLPTSSHSSKRITVSHLFWVWSVHGNCSATPRNRKGLRISRLVTNVTFRLTFRQWHRGAWLVFLHVSWRACKMGFSREIMLQSWKNRSCQSSALRTWRKASSLSSIRSRRSLPWTQGNAEHISSRHTPIVSRGLLYTPIPTASQSTEKNEGKKKINVQRSKMTVDAHKLVSKMHKNASGPVPFAVSMRMPCSSNSEELEGHFARGHACCAHKPIGEHTLRSLRYESSWIVTEVWGLCGLLTWLWALLNLRLAKWKSPRGVLHTTIHYIHYIHYHFLSDSLA